MELPILNNNILLTPDRFNNQKAGEFEETFNVMIDRCIPCEYFIPNIFNPNSRVGNEVFQIKASNLDCFNNGRIIILDRWGNIMFEDAADAPWNGRVNGTLVEEGIYVYSFTATVENETITRHGSITVLN